jgi:hypothetical protein
MGHADSSREEEEAQGIAVPRTGTIRQRHDRQLALYPRAAASAALEKPPTRAEPGAKRSPGFVVSGRSYFPDFSRAFAID